MAFNKPKIGMLPHDRYVADIEWINEHLNNLNEEERIKICTAYSNVFREASKKELTDHKKENAGRFAANTRLRLFMKKRSAVFNK